MAENAEEVKNFLIQVKQENEKDGLKFNNQKTQNMVYSPITSL